VDFILNGKTAIEVKAKENITPHDLKGLRALAEEELLKHFVVVSLVQTDRIEDGIRILNWKSFLQQLWEGKFS
jgi:uncharacterized protein